MPLTNGLLISLTGQTACISCDSKPPHISFVHEYTGGKGVLIQELNSKDAFVAAPGGAAVTVESLAGTCVLSAGGPAPSRAARPALPQGVEAHLSGRVGQVMLLSHGGPIRLYLPHKAGARSAAPGAFPQPGMTDIHSHPACVPALHGHDCRHSITPRLLPLRVM